jgi:tRNA(fMet)-specific endonuclease VapC
MYLLDTNVCIAVINGTPRDVCERFDSVAELGVDMCVSCVSVFELSYGVEKSTRRENNGTQLRTFLGGAIVLPFERLDAGWAGELRQLLERRGTPIGPYDTLIAGQALARGLVLVTHNLGEFGRVPGLRVEDWQG